MDTTIELRLTRLDDDGLPGTPGELVLWKDDEILFQCRTLELDDLDNAKDISCIPEGCYSLTARRVGGFAGRAHKLFNHPFIPWIREPEGRDFILVHWGNYLSSTAGCVLVGETAGKHNGQHVVWQSKKAYRRFFNAIRETLEQQDIPFIIEDGTNEQEDDLTEDRSKI